MFGLSKERFLNLFSQQYFTGDTLENFRTCATLQNGSVVYDKRLCPEFRNPNIYLGGLQIAFYRALRKAVELQHLPILLSASFLKGISSLHPDYDCPGIAFYLPDQKPLTVSSVWMFKSEVDWHSLDPSSSYRMENEKLKEFLVCYNPIQILQSELA